MSLETFASESTVQAATPTHKRGCLFYVKRGLAGLLILIVALCLLGLVYESSAEVRDRQTYLPPGQMLDVDGHQMHLLCSGTGSPTVILDGGETALWAWIQPTVAQSARVCSYDRAGYGWSEAGPEPRDAKAVASELHTLLDEAGVEPPYILVGHSFGGIYARVFRSLYPEDVVGMVLLDATHPDNFTRQGESLDTLRMASSVAAVLSRIGLMRLFAASQSFDLPAAENATLIANMSAAQYWDASRADAAAMASALDEGRAAGDLGNLPLAVLVALTYPEGRPRDTERALQLELAALSSNTLYEEIDGAGHITLLTNERYAGFVSEAIRAVIELRADGSAPGSIVAVRGRSPLRPFNNQPHKYAFRLPTINPVAAYSEPIESLNERGKSRWICQGCSAHPGRLDKRSRH